MHIIWNTTGSDVDSTKSKETMTCFLTEPRHLVDPIRNGDTSPVDARDKGTMYCPEYYTWFYRCFSAQEYACQFMPITVHPEQLLSMKGVLLRTHPSITEILHQLNFYHYLWIKWMFTFMRVEVARLKRQMNKGVFERIPWLLLMNVYGEHV